MFKKTVLSVAVCVALSFMTGCQSLSGTSAKPDPRLQQEEINVDGTSYATSCAVGAGVGLLACALAGSDDASCYVAAAAAGCGVGMLGNALLDNLRKDYATREAQLDALISYVSRNNEQAQKLAAAAETVYKEDQQRLAQIKKDIASGSMQAKDIQYTIARYDANIDLLQDNIKGHEKAIESYENARKGIIADAKNKPSKAERKRIAEYDRRIAQLQKDIEEIRSTCSDFIRDRDVLKLAANQSTKVEKVS